MGHDQNGRNERHEACLRYAARRREARELTALSLSDITATVVHLDDITPDAILQTKEWRHAYPDLRQGNWDWEKIIKLFRRRAKHVELAALLEFYKSLGYNNATTKGRKVIRLSKTLR
ncbi:hypothetical protein [Rugamonas sp. DEMB1]|uniref:hypothetical protein n=1 Tax=Rugamonas sp. DEMB1 TaxID=3039386 RepID=UPI00244BB5D7|nr:hypothetical protein [Rugamonas sp. DEMB1]WGG51711.1 hypothetical protein QC826_05655 [Rugamonas sp. DEMB1]